MNRALPLILCGLAALLAVALAWAWWRPASPLHAPAWVPPAPVPLNLDDVRGAMLGVNPIAQRPVPLIAERPLFMPSRRPPPPPAASSEPAAPPPIALDKVRLLGIVTGPALNQVMAEVDGSTRMLAVGDRVGDWSLASIQGRDVEFTRDGERRTLPLPDGLLNPPLPTGAAMPGQPQVPAAARGARTQPSPAARRRATQ